jgi:pantetheine-phosphate adenylyltransferase
MANEIIYPGTFDPITNGHIDLIERATRLFSRVTVAISAVSSKKTIFTLEERCETARKALLKYDGVEVCGFSGLLVDFSKAKGIDVILRGFRAITDFEYELQLANMNRVMNAKMETVFLTPSEKYTYVSSSLVREIASLGGDVSPFVPEAARLALKDKFALNQTFDL